MEYIDVVDDRGNPSGEKKTKEETHRDQDWHPTVHVWIVNSKGDILFQKRSEDKVPWPGKWDVSVAGHISSGEQPLATAVREAEEEVGLSFSENQFESFLTIGQSILFETGKFHKSWTTSYIVYADIDVSTLRLQAEEVSEARFIPYRDFQEKLRAGAEDFVPQGEEYVRLLQELARKYP